MDDKPRKISAIKTKRHIQKAMESIRNEHGNITMYTKKYQKEPGAQKNAGTSIYRDQGQAIIKIGQHLLPKTNRLLPLNHVKTEDNVKALTSTLIAIGHETKHAEQFLERCDDDTPDGRLLAIQTVAYGLLDTDPKTRQYYDTCWSSHSFEVEAEYNGILFAHAYISEQIPELDAEKCILDWLKDPRKTGPNAKRYILSPRQILELSSMKDVEDIFEQTIEETKTRHKDFDPHKIRGGAADFIYTKFNQGLFQSFYSDMPGDVQDLVLAGVARKLSPDVDPRFKHLNLHDLDLERTCGPGWRKVPEPGQLSKTKAYWTGHFATRRWNSPPKAAPPKPFLPSERIKTDGRKKDWPEPNNKKDDQKGPDAPLGP